MKRRKRNRQRRSSGKYFVGFALLYWPTCQWCGCRIFKMNGTRHNNTATRDHVIPVAHGGKNSWDNYVLSCYRCNIKKGSSLPLTVPRGPVWQVDGSGNPVPPYKLREQAKNMVSR